jgi:WD40 repeat protein
VLRGHTNIVHRVAFSPNGTRLASCCADNTILLWDVAVAEQAGGREAPDAEVAELHGHEDYVHAVDWSPDGTRLLSTSGEGTVRVWDSLSAQERAKRSAPAAEITEKRTDSPSPGGRAWGALGIDHETLDRIIGTGRREREGQALTSGSLDGR